MDWNEPIAAWNGIQLRGLLEEDSPAFFELIQNNRQGLEDFFSGTVSRNKTSMESRQFIQQSLERREKGTYFPFVLLHDERELIGFLDVKNIDPGIPKAEIGYFMDRHFEGKGICSEAVSQMLNYCFNILQLNKVYLRSHADNKASCRIAEKNGFEQEGTLRCDYKTSAGVLIDVLYFGLLHPRIRKGPQDTGKIT